MPQHYIYNVSNSADTTEDVLRRFESEAERRGVEDYPSIVVMATGVNDAFRNGSGLRQDLGSTESDLRDLVEKAREHANTVILVGCSPVDPWNNSVRDTGYEVRNKDLGRIDDLKLAVSEDRDAAEFIDLAARPESDSFSWSDGIHPDTGGHRQIYDAVKEPLMSHLE